MCAYHGDGVVVIGGVGVGAGFVAGVHVFSKQRQQEVKKKGNKQCSILGTVGINQTVSFLHLQELQKRLHYKYASSRISPFFNSVDMQATRAPVPTCWDFYCTSITQLYFSTQSSVTRCFNWRSSQLQTCKCEVPMDTDLDLML